MFEAIAVGIFLSIVSNRIVEAFVAPLKKKFPAHDFWWLLYVTWLVGGVLAWFANVNLFAAYMPDALLAGRILSCVTVGGGSQLINDIFSMGAQDNEPLG